jgi:signal transduction histidine kinase
MAERKEHFEIHASVVFQLGESLITSPVQALLELIKNSYDADASYCKVTIITAGPPPEGTNFPNANGWIVIEDDGSGMDLSDIQLGWLTISNSRKREFKRTKKVTLRGRTPLGDKGLGRLGTQRLGSNLEMVTHKDGGEQYTLAIPWDDFRTEAQLSKIAITVKTEKVQAGHGTKLIISELGDLDLWRGEATKQLQKQLSELVSPYEETRDFIIVVTADGQKIELAEIGRTVRNAAQLHYEIDFDGALRLLGAAKLSYFRPGKEPDRSMFQELVESDSGKLLFDFLVQLPGATRFNFKQAKAPWFIKYSQTRAFEDFPEMQRIRGEIADPGPFRGIVDYFSLASEETKSQSVFGSAKEFKDLINAYSGIRVFRDGFGIRVDRDWLMLGAQQTKGSSWYGLRPQNTLGFIALSASENSQLEETTDREGFKHTPHYENFYELLQSFIDFSADAQEFLRRGWNEYRRKMLTAEVVESYSVPAEELGSTLSEAITRAASHRISLQTMANKLRHSATATTDALRVLLAQPGAKGSAEKINNQLEDLRADIESAALTLEKVEAYLLELGGLEKVNQVLKDQIDALRDQVSRLHEVVGLGLTAEALTHEMNNIASELAARTQQLTRHIKAKGITDPRVISFLDYVKTTVNSFHKQLQFLAPSLQYVREKRERINLKEFTDEMFRHYLERFAGEPISLQIGRFDPNFHVSINKGKLIQVLDNLFLNSEYWLRADIKANRLTRGVIKVNGRKPILSVEDNGRGIDPLLESSIFEPFVSGKGKGKGRGLGLYIVRQLLEAENCHIDVSPERNKFDRLFKFDVDLSGVLID